MDINVIAERMEEIMRECPYCKSNKVRKNGKSRETQRMQCMICKKRKIEQSYGVNNLSAKVTLAIFKTLDFMI